MAGSSPSASAAATGGAGNYTFLIVIVVLFALMYFVMIRPQRNRQRQMMQMQRGVTPGARVRTTAGMYATVTSVEGDEVILEVAPGVHVRYLRRAIMDVISEGGPAPEEPLGNSSGSGESAGSGESDTTAEKASVDAENGRSAN